MTGKGKSRTRVALPEQKPPVDGETLSFLAAAFERVIVAEYRQMLAGKLSHFEARLWEIDRALTSCPKCHVMDGLADMIQELHDGLAEIAAAAERRGQALGAGHAQVGSTTEGVSPSRLASDSLTSKDLSLWRRKLRNRARPALGDQPGNLVGCSPAPAS
jgi:hypothetical protein